MTKHLARACLAIALSLALLPAAPAEAPPLKPVNLSVNTKADEDEPFLASRGLTLYYACNAKGKWDVMVSRRASVQKSWPAGDELQDYIATEADDRGACATAEDRYPQYLYFASKQDKKNDNYDLYVAVKQGPTKAFTEARAVVGVNTPADEMHPWLSADGRQLYFSRRTKESWRVFVATRRGATGPQGFGEPAVDKELPPGFHHATLSPDGRTMYLQGPLEKERWGLFVRTKTGGVWDKPVPLGQLNHPDGPTGDRSPALSRDGSMLYFASDRPGGKGGLDLYVVRTADLKANRLR